MNKNEILDYISNTPYNSNRQVLGYMLDDIDSGESSSLLFPTYKCDFIRDIDSTLVLTPIEGPTNSLFCLDAEDYYMIIDSTYTPAGFIITPNGIGEINSIALLESGTSIHYTLWSKGK